jgi:hypothetical protein
MHLQWLWLLLPILVGVAVLLATVRGRVRHVSNEPQCGKCGYNVTGLPGTVCPECGSDLATVGIRWPGAPVPYSRLVRGIGWTLFVILAVWFPMLVLFTVLEPSLPKVCDWTQSRHLEWPASDGYDSIQLDVRVHAVAWTKGPTPQSVVITLLHKGGGRQQATITRKNGAAWDEARLVGWMREGGVSGDDRELHNEARVVVAHVDELLATPMDAGSSHTFSSSGGRGADPSYVFASYATSDSGTVHPPGGYALVPSLLAFMIWVLGLRRLLRRPGGITQPKARNLPETR